jgi:hypothetical protein
MVAIHAGRRCDILFYITEDPHTGDSIMKPVDYQQFVEVMRKSRDYWMPSESSQ